MIGLSMCIQISAHNEYACALNTLSHALLMCYIVFSSFCLLLVSDCPLGIHLNSFRFFFCNCSCCFALWPCQKFGQFVTLIEFPFGKAIKKMHNKTKWGKTIKEGEVERERESGEWAKKSLHKFAYNCLNLPYVRAYGRKAAGVQERAPRRSPIYVSLWNAKHAPHTTCSICRQLLPGTLPQVYNSEYPETET